MQMVFKLLYLQLILFWSYTHTHTHKHTKRRQKKERTVLNEWWYLKVFSFLFFSFYFLPLINNKNIFDMLKKSFFIRESVKFADYWSAQRIEQCFKFSCKFDTSWIIVICTRRMVFVELPCPENWLKQPFFDKIFLKILIIYRKWQALFDFLV